MNEKEKIKQIAKLTISKRNSTDKKEIESLEKEIKTARNELFEIKFAEKMTEMSNRRESVNEESRGERRR